ncbi:uncharacterized protein CLUP02_07650 [Colletotrichum lupini]|uniref:Uncharacterized protein n=1 Tax=Colletotrichum lupini TaxID=145971 RepID=A0A9Q8WG59_9PEZI|nr:uncharacterized protein CLUP02_07650 [Colletotrichum lupini]UQC82164.1 hypothetical protein CLUP02_07650 [Colletotrichum lupini]
MILKGQVSNNGFRLGLKDVSLPSRRGNIIRRPKLSDWAERDQLQRRKAMIRLHNSLFLQPSTKEGLREAETIPPSSTYPPDTSVARVSSTWEWVQLKKMYSGVSQLPCGNFEEAFIPNKQKIQEVISTLFLFACVCCCILFVHLESSPEILVSGSTVARNSKHITLSPKTTWMDGPEFAKEIKPYLQERASLLGIFPIAALCYILVTFIEDGSSQLAIGPKGDSTLLNDSIDMRAISKTSASFFRTLKTKLQYLSRMKIAALRRQGPGRAPGTGESLRKTMLHSLLTLLRRFNIETLISLDDKLPSTQPPASRFPKIRNDERNSQSQVHNGASVCNPAPLCSGPEAIPLETMVEKYPCYPPGPRQCAPKPTRYPAAEHHFPLTEYSAFVGRLRLKQLANTIHLSNDRYIGCFGFCPPVRVLSVRKSQDVCLTRRDFQPVPILAFPTSYHLPHIARRKKAHDKATTQSSITSTKKTSSDEREKLYPPSPPPLPESEDACDIATCRPAAGIVAFQGKDASTYPDEDVISPSQALFQNATLKVVSASISRSSVYPSKFSINGSLETRHLSLVLFRLHQHSTQIFKRKRRRLSHGTSSSKDSLSQPVKLQAKGSEKELNSSLIVGQTYSRSVTNISATPCSSSVIASSVIANWLAVGISDLS